MDDEYKVEPISTSTEPGECLMSQHNDLHYSATFVDIGFDQLLQTEIDLLKSKDVKPPEDQKDYTKAISDAYNAMIHQNLQINPDAFKFHE